jgi:hypothetical protein
MSYVNFNQAFATVLFLIANTAIASYNADLKAGFISDDLDAQHKCPAVCAGPNSHWNGNWKSIIPRKTSVWGCPESEISSHVNWSGQVRSGPLLPLWGQRCFCRCMLILNIASNSNQGGAKIAAKSQKHTKI